MAEGGAEKCCLFVCLGGCGGVVCVFDGRMLARYECLHEEVERLSALESEIVFL